MDSKPRGWIHNFTVTETSKHIQGYTIYKITSIVRDCDYLETSTRSSLNPSLFQVFPRSLPQALTCVTVWKRFHDIKRLYRDLCRRQKILQLDMNIPQPANCIFFRRFDEAIIENRKKYILELLDVVGQHQELYKSQAFIEFFNCGHSPIATIDHGDYINKKCSFNGSCASRDFDDNHKLLNIFDVNNDDKIDGNCDPVDAGNKQKSQATNGKELLPNNKNFIDTFGLPSPTMSMDTTNNDDYIYEAALEFSRAVQAEANLNYLDAYEKYKRGIDVLRKGSQGDDKDERKFIAKTKISKYLTRADDIINKYLKNNCEINNSDNQLTVNLVDDNALPNVIPQLELPWNYLSKYKVQRILGDRVMQVQCITESLQSVTYVIKGIEKPPNNSLARTIFLPQNIPYMVDLLGFFQSEEKIFLLLKLAEGGRLYDYVLSYKPLMKRYCNLNEIFSEIEIDPETSDSSNLSVQDSGFVDDCKLSSLSTNSLGTKATETETTIKMDSNSQTSFKKETIPQMNTGFQVNAISQNETISQLAVMFHTEITSQINTTTMEVSELVNSSQQLLKSVSNILKCSKKRSLPNNNSESISEQHPHSSNDSLIILPEVCLKQWASELAIAIHSLHSKGVILGDLHMENLLLGTKGQLLLTYFYQCEEADDDIYLGKLFNAEALVGHYVAPERPVTTKSDWWSYGVILYNLLLGLPFKEVHPGRIEIYGCVQYPEASNISDDARDLIDNLLKINQDIRFGYKEIKEHRFFKGIDWYELIKKGTE